MTILFTVAALVLVSILAIVGLRRRHSTSRYEVGPVGQSWLLSKRSEDR